MTRSEWMGCMKCAQGKKWLTVPCVPNPHICDGHEEDGQAQAGTAFRICGQDSGQRGLSSV